MSRFHLIYPLAIGLLLTACGNEKVTDAHQTDVLPDIYPDYAGVTIPVNIAPLNFCMDNAVCIDVSITDSHGHSLHAQGRHSTDIDPKEWQAMLANNAGDSLLMTVSAKSPDGRWTSYQPFSIHVSTDSIDYGITYRLIEPGYEVWSKMGIYERELTSYRQTPLIENTQFDGCVNCHSFRQGSPADMSLHIRGGHSATLLRHQGHMEALQTSTDSTLGLCVYPYWHPSGRYIAYSTNTTRQVFHIQHSNRIEVFDMASDVQIYDIATNELITPDLLKSPDILETFPAFSPDGRMLYYCASSSKANNAQELDSVHYNLCAVTFDPETGSIGTNIDTLFQADALTDSLGHVLPPKSAVMPRPSYDGRHLVFTLCDYGQFPIWHHEADLYIMDLASREVKPMTTINSPDTDSYHSWSSNSRWMVFSSRRDDGLFTRPYFTHIDEHGNATKPFMLPQADPRHYYGSLFMSYNVPEFVTAPVDFDRLHAADLINSDARKAMKVRKQ